MAGRPVTSFWQNDAMTSEPAPSAAQAMTGGLDDGDRGIV